jgi:DNA-binding XRE family transcriptional regulator
MSTDELVRVAKGREYAASGIGRLARTRARLSLAAVGQAVGAEPTTVLRWESGRFMPLGEHAVRYAGLVEALLRD